MLGKHGLARILHGRGIPVQFLPGNPWKCVGHDVVSPDEVASNDLTTPRGCRLLGFGQETRQGHAERRRDCSKRGERSGLAAALQLTDANAVEPARFGELLLRNPGRVPVCAQDLPTSRQKGRICGCHARSVRAKL